ncbi:MAG: hypothetical protein J7M29_02680 [Verrucomicrobia bacterium]|nr:hypothetical protein [Verrucomicrobiota bacterium]
MTDRRDRAADSEPRMRPRWTATAIYAVAMAWMEAAVVLYLRTLSNRIVPYQADPLPDQWPALGLAELVREAATMVMLAAVGWLAGRNFRARFGYFLVAFGLWDIFYYVFLRVLTGWPHSLLDWDVLFLIPVPWWGPVIAPALIALLMVATGSLMAHPFFDRNPWRPSRAALAACALGALAALYAFMADALPRIGEGVEALRKVLPERFLWGVYLLGLVGMAAPAADLALRMLRGNRVSEANPEAERAGRVSRPRCP